MQSILVIDDELMVLEAMVAFLEDAGLTVIGAQSGEEGIRLAREHLPRVIVSDYSMPGLSGRDVLRAVKQDDATKHIPFVLFTAHATPDIRKECFGLGADAVFSKAVVAEELLKTVQRMTEMAE